MVVALLQGLLTLQTADPRRLHAAPKQEVRHGDRSPRQPPEHDGHSRRSRTGPPPGDGPISPCQVIGKSSNSIDQLGSISEVLHRRLYLIQELLDDADATSTRTWTELLQQLHIPHLEPREPIRESACQASSDIRPGFSPEVWVSGLVCERR